MAEPNNPTDAPARIEGKGTFTPPDGMTVEQARQLAEQADKERSQ